MEFAGARREVDATGCDSTIQHSTSRARPPAEAGMAWLQRATLRTDNAGEGPLQCRPSLRAPQRSGRVALARQIEHLLLTLDMNPPDNIQRQSITLFAAGLDAQRSRRGSRAGARRAW